MTAGWVPYWDDSYNPVPISRLGEMYAAGFRVWARYLAGGGSGKWWTDAEIAAWFALGDDTGVFVLFEAVGDEPVTHPELGDDHARAVRAAARAQGLPDHVSIGAAMDRNVDTTQWQGAIATYCQHWDGADTALVTMYIEADAGDYLYGRQLTTGTFVPAAYGWNNPPVLYTPANAPAHVVATQEHNGRQMAGGTVDIGHIRTTARCVWWNPTQAGDTPVSSPLTTANAGPAVVDAPGEIPTLPSEPDHATLPKTTLATAIYRLRTAAADEATHEDVAEILAALADVAEHIGTLPTLAQIQQLLAGVVPAAGGVTPAQIAAADRAAADTLDPPAGN